MAEIRISRPIVMEPSTAMMLDSALASPMVVDMLSSSDRHQQRDTLMVPSSYPTTPTPSSSTSGDQHRRMRNTKSESSVLALLARRSTPEHRYFVAQFLLPSTSDVRSRLSDHDQRICLRSFSANRYHLTGTVLVKAGGGNGERVFVRYSLDNWRTCVDKSTTFLDHDAANGCDRFHFRLDFPFRMPNETRLQLAVAYCHGHHTYWDNNGGHNYTFVYNNYRSNSGLNE